MNYIFIGIIVIFINVLKKEHRNSLIVIGTILVFIDLILSLLLIEESSDNIWYNLGFHLLGLIGLLVTEKAEIKKKN